MNIGPRNVSEHVQLPSREGNGTSFYWSRTINDTPYSFTLVLMPSGERRYEVKRYNGYCIESVRAGYVTVEQLLRLGCAWSPVHFIVTNRHIYDLCSKCGRCTRNACESHQLCYC